jgi:phosphatidylserine/phosphatidylglycerophosphate/cardiolipin synthase-like enzyme
MSRLDALRMRRPRFTIEDSSRTANVSALQRLYITTPYFVPDETIRSAVASRARAGVDVRILSTPRFAEQMEAAFRGDLARAQEIQPEQWRRRSALARVLERAAALFAEQY